MSAITRLTAISLLTMAVLYLGAQQVTGQRFAPGYCPTVTPHENFDKSKFFGNWIEVEKTPSIFDLMMRCLVVDYSDDQDNTVNVVVRGVSLAGLPLTVNGDGLLQDMHKAGYYSIRYGFGVPFQGTLTTIIDTDYEDYAVVYSCTNSLLSGVFHSEYIWLLSRSGKISNPIRQNIYEKLDKLAINRSGLTMSDRSTCPSNSSIVARESDSNLASQASVPSIATGSQAPVVESAGGASPSANLEKVNAEPTQKSVVVPLLYDPPSPASSASVGGSKPSVSKLAPPAPVENKVPQLPLSSVPASQKQQASAVKPVQQQPSPVQAPAQPVASGSSQQQAAPISVPAVAKPASSSQSVQSQPAQQQASALMAKIQPKP